ncbi:hypothetical protein [Okeania sp.]|uniref:hypothetical protein n=1 Tax=Okeania sp. TaxID=3100323 RepID=UPI002B4B6CE2|nr:hypothetical protein [Okeania sp.]MEB3341819.1 hypothetical protein [Okeania sp.]
MNDLYLRVFKDQSELVQSNGKKQIFLEGKMSHEARIRYHKITNELANNYLEKQILACRDRNVMSDGFQLEQSQINTLNKLVNSVTSEVGRALVGLTILQLCIKSIEPKQSIRLHKSSTNRNAFSWQEGIPMRSLDKQYITPILRKYELLKLNADGFMMTRSLAENYPYSPVYKANIRGARLEWLSLVELIEENQIDSKNSLHYLISQLLNNAREFQKLATETLDYVQNFLDSSEVINQKIITNLIWRHIEESDYAARIMEIAIHSLMQAMEENQLFPDCELKPLSQMRSANKKHGNIGDIEILEKGNIIEAWDAKYGKAYLRDEIEELADKLLSHSHVKLAGFVTSVKLQRQSELISRCEELEEEFGISLEILTFIDWVQNKFNQAIEKGFLTEEKLAGAWLIAYAESIAQKRRNIAPIDEPCQQWLVTLKDILEDVISI